MRICVIGAGVVGLTTAHALLQRGLQVTLMEAEPGAGAVTCFGNGAQLAYGFADPVGNPALLADLPRVLAGRSPGIRVRQRANWRYVSWVAQLLWQSLPHNARRNGRALEQCAQRASVAMANLLPQPGLDYYHAATGKLVLLPGEPTAQLRSSIERSSHQGAQRQLLTRAAAEEREPALQHWQSSFSHTLFSPSDAVADAYEFAVALAARLQAQGVVCRYNTRVLRLRRRGQQTIVHQASTEDAFDAVVVCAGNAARQLVSGLGVRLPVYPVTGYSVTLPETEYSNRLSITAAAARLVFAPVRRGLRIAGFADINIAPERFADRVKELLATASGLAPAAADYSTPHIHAWRGERPSTPNSLPIVGASGVPGVYLNVGHGMLGWTLCPATAEAVAEHVIG